MKRTTLAMVLALTGGATVAQERPPLILKAIELGVANSVVVRKCKGWLLNPTITAQLLVAIGLAGLTDQFERIDEAEVIRMADRSIADHWSPDRVEAQCAAVRSMTAPNPMKPDETLQLFVQSQ
jgi:hypothetical protein